MFIFNILTNIIMFIVIGAGMFISIFIWKDESFNVFEKITLIITTVPVSFLIFIILYSTIAVIFAPNILKQL